jgi:hypothetical protein
VSWLLCRGKEWGPPPRSFAADAHGCIMVRVLGLTEYKVVARLIRATESGLPSDRHPRPYRVCRRARSCQGMAWQGPKYVERLVRRPTLTASSARRLCNAAGRGEETGFPGRTKKPMKKARKRDRVLRPLDRSPYKAQAEKPRGRKYRCAGEGRTAS